MKVSGEMHKGAFIGFFQGISGIIFLKPSDTLYETFQGFDSSHFILRSLKCIQIQWLPKMFVHLRFSEKIFSKISIHQLKLSFLDQILIIRSIIYS